MPLRPSIPATVRLVSRRCGTRSAPLPPDRGSIDELPATRVPLIGPAVAVALAAAMVVAGCATPTAPLPSIQTVDDLRASLEAAGASVETGETHPAGIFSVPGQELLVDGTMVGVYVFADEAAAEAEVPRLEQALVLWAAPVRLYRSGPVLALLVGGTSDVRRTFEKVMGAPVARVG